MADTILKNPEQPSSCLTVCWFRQNLPLLCSDSSSMGRVTFEILSLNSRPNNLSLRGVPRVRRNESPRTASFFPFLAIRPSQQVLQRSGTRQSSYDPRKSWDFGRDPRRNPSWRLTKTVVSNRDSVSISSVWNWFSDRSGNCRKGCHKTSQDTFCPHWNSKRPATGPFICDQDFWRERVFR